MNCHSIPFIIMIGAQALCTSARLRSLRLMLVVHGTFRSTAR